VLEDLRSIVSIDPLLKIVVDRQVTFFPKWLPGFRATHVVADRQVRELRYDPRRLAVIVEYSRQLRQFDCSIARASCKFQNKGFGIPKYASPTV
jgi:hypothetical protein